WFPLHICGVKPTVSEELQFNQQVCRGEAKHTLHTCETPRSYCRTSVVPTQSASICTGVNELMSRAEQVTYDDRPLRWHGLVKRSSEPLQDLPVGELGKQSVHRLIQPQLTFLHQDHRCRGRDRLGH